MKLVALLVAVAGAAVLATSQARADEQAPEPAPEQAPEQPSAQPAEQPIVEAPPAKSYGLQTAIVDASSVALVGTSFIAFSAGERSKGSFFSWAGFFGLAGYTFGAPIVHWAHDQMGKGFASLGLRIAAPLVAAGAFGLTGALIKAGRGGTCYGRDDDAEDHCQGPAVAVGVSVGVLAIGGVMLLDALVLAKEPARPATRSSASRVFGDLTPSFQLGADRAALGVSGTLF